MSAKKIKFPGYYHEWDKKTWKEKGGQWFNFDGTGCHRRLYNDKVIESSYRITRIDEGEHIDYYYK